MAFPNNRLLQDAVYWPPTAAGDYGKPGFGPGVAIKCRWEDDYSEEATATGTDAHGAATVYVDRDLEVGGVLWLGKLAAANAQPLANAGATIIDDFKKIPTLRANAVQRIAIL